MISGDVFVVWILRKNNEAVNVLFVMFFILDLFYPE